MLLGPMGLRVHEAYKFDQARLRSRDLAFTSLVAGMDGDDDERDEELDPNPLQGHVVAMQTYPGPVSSPSSSPMA